MHFLQPAGLKIRLTSFAAGHILYFVAVKLSFIEKFIIRTRLLVANFGAQTDSLSKSGSG